MRRIAWVLVVMAGMGFAGCAGPATVAAGGVGGRGGDHVTTMPAAAGNFIHVRALIIVRHADIDIATKKTMGSQAPLTARGEERAKELAHALKDAGITRIVTSETLRTQETAQVLAKELGLELDSPFGHGGGTLTAEQYAAAKKAEAGNVLKYLAESGKPEEVVLLVHHHSVIPGLMKLLGYAEPPIVEDSEFDRVYVVLPQEKTGTYKIMRLRYGGKWGE